MFHRLNPCTMASVKRLSVENDEELNQEVITEDYCYRPQGHSPLRHRSPGRLPPPQPIYSKTVSANITQDPHWQSNCSTLKERNAAMFNNQLMADIYFKVGSKQNMQRIPAHKYILATGSTVFYAMCYGGLANASSEEEIPDVEPVAFLNLLRYLYTDEIKLEADTVLATLYAAKKYIVPHLAKECVHFLETSLTAKNACVLLSQSRLFEETDLMQRCWEVLDAQAEEALHSEGFTEIDYNTLMAILERESINAGEVSIFHAVNKWAEAECCRQDLQPTAENKRKVLGCALYKVRIPSMKVEQFADTAAQSGLLTLEEINNIFLYYTAQNKPRVPFETRRRRGLVPQRCLRFQSCAFRSNQWRYRGRCDSIQFCVDRRIFIAGVGLYGSSNGQAEYSVTMELKRNGVKLAQKVSKFLSNGTSDIFPMCFEYPIQIEAETYYTVSATLDGTELSYFGQEGMAEVNTGGINFQFQCSSDSTNGTGVQGGQIPELIFYC